jgi:hypothetical protein
VARGDDRRFVNYKGAEIMTQKELRKIARKAIADYLIGKSKDLNIACQANAALHAPQRRGE